MKNHHGFSAPGPVGLGGLHAARGHPDVRLLRRPDLSAAPPLVPKLGEAAAKLSKGR